MQIKEKQGISRLEDEKVKDRHGSMGSIEELWKKKRDRQEESTEGKEERILR